MPPGPEPEQELVVIRTFKFMYGLHTNDDDIPVPSITRSTSGGSRCSECYREQSIPYLSSHFGV